MNWIKSKLRKWLGIEELDHHYRDIVSLGIDVHFKKPHMILIYSHFNGGLIRHIEADFRDPKELNSLVHELKNRYRTKNVIYDTPFIMRDRDIDIERFLDP